jgi:enhancing lycopene biosynthesis protein 2
MTKLKKIAVVLSGNGVFDGAEIHESVLTLLAIAKAGASYQVFAPDMEQYHVINHITGEPMDEKRNVLIEAARIARGNILPLDQYKPADYDALIMPGGFGAAKNLSSFAFDGANCMVNKSVEVALKSTHEAGKPIGALCIAPVILARLFKDARVTIGGDEGTAAAIGEMGGVHEVTSHGEVVVDTALKLATTPCYMLDANVQQIAEGAENVVEALLKMTN